MRAARGTPGYLASRSARRGGALGGADAFAASTLPRNAFLESLDEEGSGDADWRGEGDARAGEGGGGADGGRGDGSLASAASAVGEDIDFDTIVTSWGDYSKTTLSPRSLVGVGGRAPTGETYGPSGAAAGLRSGTANFDAFSDGCVFLPAFAAFFTVYLCTRTITALSARARTLETLSLTRPTHPLFYFIPALGCSTRAAKTRFAVNLSPATRLTACRSSSTSTAGGGDSPSMHSRRYVTTPQNAPFSLSERQCLAPASLRVPRGLVETRAAASFATGLSATVHTSAA